MATDSTHLLAGDTGIETDSDMSAGSSDLGGVQLAAAPADAPVPVNIPRGQQVVVIPVQPGQTIQLPTDSPDGLLAKLGADGNLAIVVDGRTIILQGYAAANAESPISIVTSDGDIIEIVEVIAATDPGVALDIETAAGPAAGAQGGTGDAAGSGIFVPFAAGPLLGGFDAAGVLGATQLAYKSIDDDRVLFTTLEEDAEEPDGDIDIVPETVVGEVSFAGGFEDWQPNQDVCDPPVAPMALNIIFTPADNEVLLSLKLGGFPQGATLFIGDPTDGLVEPGEDSILFVNVDPASNVVVLTPEQIALGIFLLPPQDASGNIDLDYTATIQDPDGGLIADISGSKEVVIDAVAEDAEITWAKPIENEVQEQPAGFPTDPDTTSAECEPVVTHVVVNEDNATAECEEEYEQSRVELAAVPRECCPIDGEPVYPIGFRADTRDDDGSEGITRVLIAFTENESDDGSVNADADLVDVSLDDEAAIILNGTTLSGAGTIVVDGEISQADDGAFVPAKITLGYAYTVDGLVLTVQSAEVGGNPVDPFAVQSLDLTDMQIALPQHDSDDFRLDVTVTTQELFIDGELTADNNEATHTETLIYNIIPIADGAEIDGGDEGHPEEGCETQKFVEDDQPDPLQHGPNAAESNLEIPLTFATSLIDADGTEGVTEIKIFLSADLGGSDNLAGLTFFDADGELTGANTTVTLGLSGGGSAEFTFSAAPNVTGWEITLVPVDPAEVLGKNVSLDSLIVKTPIDDSTDIRADFYVTTGEYENGQLVDESCKVGHDCVVYQIAGVVGPAVTAFVGAEDFIEDGGKSTEECQDSQFGPLRVDLGGLAASAQDQDGSEGIALVTLDPLPGGFSYTGVGGGALPLVVNVQVSSLENGPEVVQATLFDAGGTLQIILPPLVVSGYDIVLLLPGQLFVQAPADFSGDFQVTYSVVTQEFDDDGTGGGTLSTPGAIQFHVDPASDKPIVQLEGNKIEGEISFYYEDGTDLPAQHGDDATESKLVVPINFQADVTDSSEGLTKFTLFFDGAETGSILQIDGVTIADGASNVAVEIDGHAGLASYSANLLTVVFDPPVPDGVPALQVTDEITLLMPIDDSTDFTAYVKVWSSELDGEGNALDPDGHCTAEDFLPIVIQGVVGPAITDFTGETDFIEDGAESAEECQTPRTGPLTIDLGGLKGTAQDSDGSEGVIRFLLKELPEGFIFTDGSGNPVAGVVPFDVNLTASEFGGADTAIVGHVTLDGDNLVITIDDATAPATGWDIVTLDTGQIKVKVPQNFSGDFEVDYQVRTEEYDDEIGPGSGTFDTDGTIPFHVDPAPDDPTIDVLGTDEDGDSSTYYEDNQSDPTKHGKDADESHLLVPVNFTADVGDPSEGLVKFSIAFSDQDPDAELMVDGVAIGDGAVDVAVEIAGHAGKASYSGGVLTVVFDDPVTAAGLPLAVNTGEIQLKLPIDDSDDFDALVSVYSSELDEEGNALDPDGHCSAEDTLAVTVRGVVGPALTEFSGATDFIEDGGEEGVCQTPETGPLLINLGGIKGTAQDNDGSEGIVRIVLKALPADPSGFAYVDVNGDPIVAGAKVSLTATEFGVPGTAAITGTVSFDGADLVITIDNDANTPDNGWDSVELDAGEVFVEVPQNFSGDFDVHFQVRTQEHDDDGTGGGTLDTDGSIAFHVASATDDPTVDVFGNATKAPDFSSYDEDDEPLPVNHGADAGESQLEVPVNFTADVGDPSEGLVKVEITFADHDGDATLQINGITVGALATAVTVDGRSATAIYDGSKLVVLFDDPVTGGDLPLAVTDEIKLVLPIDDSEDFTAKVEVFSSELDEEGDAIDPEGHCSAEATLTVAVKGVVGPALITGLSELGFDEDGGLKDGEHCQDPEQGPLFMPVAFKMAAQDNDGSESIVGFAIDIRQDEADGDDAFVDGLTFVDGGGDPIAVGDTFTVKGWLFGEDPNVDPAHDVEVEITGIDGNGKVVFQVNTTGDWQVLELQSGVIRIEAPQNGNGDFELLVDAVTEEHDDDGGLNEQYATKDGTGSLVQHYTVDPVNDDPLADDVETPADVPGVVPAGALAAAGIDAADLALFKVFTVDGTVDGSNVEDPNPTLGGKDVETPLASLVFEIASLPATGVLVKFDGVTYTLMAVGDQFDSTDTIYWLTDDAGGEDLTTAFDYKVIDADGCEAEATALITGVDAAAGTLTAEGCVYEDLKPGQNVGDDTEAPEIIAISFTPNDDEVQTGGEIEIPAGWQVQVWDPVGLVEVELLAAGTHAFTQQEIADILAGDLQLRPIPPADSDVDATFTLSLDIEDPDTGATKTISSDFTVYADAVADKPTDVQIILKDSDDSGGSFAVNEVGTLQVKATFGDYTDGSETHTVTVTLQEGFTAPGLAAAGTEDGFDYTYDAASGVIVFTVPNGTQNFDATFDIKAPAVGPLPTTLNFTATATAEETTISGGGCGADHAEDTTNNKATTTATAGVPASRLLNGDFITNTNVQKQQLLITFVSAANFLLASSQIYSLDIQGQEGSVAQDVGFDIDGQEQYLLSVESAVNPKVILTDFALENTTLHDSGNLQFELNDKTAGSDRTAYTWVMTPDEVLPDQAATASTDGDDKGNKLSDSATSFDYIYGAGGKDTIDGGEGADILNGGDNADIINGKGGNDILVYDPLDTFDGGAGDDLLRIDQGAIAITKHQDGSLAGPATVGEVTVDLSGKSIANIEGILITTEAAPDPELGTTVQLKAADVLNYTDGDDTLYVLGQSGDKVQLLDPANWVDGDLVATGIQATGSFTNADGQTFNIYQTKSGGILNVDADVEVFV